VLLADGALPPKELALALLGIVVRPEPFVLVDLCDGRLEVLGSAAGAFWFEGKSLGAGVAAAVVPPTVRLLMTVFTPLTVAASLAAAIRSVSFATVPLNVTAPFVEFTVMVLFEMPESPLIFACTSLAISLSERELAERLHPAATNAISMRTAQTCLFIAIDRPRLGPEGLLDASCCCLYCH
jgi:hypothetical protein